MPASTQDYSKIKTYQDQAADKTQEAATASSTAITLGDQVMDAVKKARTERGVSKLATDTGNATGQLVSDPEGIRARTSGIVDPFSVNSLTAGARAQNLNTLGTVATQEKQNQGSVDEIIQAGANKLKARAADLLAQAQKDMADSEQLQQEWDRMFKEKQFNEDVRQFNETLANKDGGSTREKDAADFADDGLGFATAIKNGTYTWQQAHDSLSTAYPWATEADITKFIGANPTVSAQGTGTEYTGLASKGTSGLLGTWNSIYQSPTASTLRNVKSTVENNNPLNLLINKIFKK